MAGWGVVKGAERLAGEDTGSCSHLHAEANSKPAHTLILDSRPLKLNKQNRMNDCCLSHAEFTAARRIFQTAVPGHLSSEKWKAGENAQSWVPSRPAKTNPWGPRVSSHPKHPRPFQSPLKW